MEREGFKPKPLTLTYEEFNKRGCTIQNLVIDKYVVYDLIGVGSYGSVFRGMNDETKKQVAVKLINMRQIKSDQNTVVKAIKLRLAQSEPRLMYQCNSPYLLKCFDVYENQDLKILIIEYCNGKTLQAEIDEKKRIPENEAWMILKHIINGLMVLHSYRIVHRDLKAENIMSHNGTYKIIDFGFSKKLQISQQNSEIRNTSLGTITTMAPEVMGRKPYGLKADIWSLGIIFFQMIYGTYPYDSVTAPQMYREIQTKKLFNKEEPFTYNNYTPSKDAYNFLRFTVVVESQKRPDWRAVAEYPNLKNAGTDDLSQRFLKQCNLEVNKNLDYGQNYEERTSLQFDIENKGSLYPKINQQKKQEESPTKLQVKKVSTLEEKPEYKASKNEKIGQNSIQKKKINLEQIMKKEEEQRKKTEQKKRKEEIQKLKEEMRRKEEMKEQNIRGLNTEEIKMKQREINKEDENEYNWTQIAHLECLKTQFVYREIIYPLEISGIISCQDRDSLEFYYLLSARCFSNMSPINDELEERSRDGRNKELISNLRDQITRLYNQVQKKFEDFSEKLTKTQNSVTSMFKDFFSKRFDKDQFKEKDKFLTGIQKIEYSKQQQIDYTYNHFKVKLRDIISKAKHSTAVLKRLDNFKTIMMVSLQHLKAKGQNFDDYVQSVLASKK